MIIEKYIQKKLKIAVIPYLLRDLYQSAMMCQIECGLLKFFKVMKSNFDWYYFFRIEFGEQWQTDPRTLKNTGQAGPGILAQAYI
jgi:hypothetical protein